MKEESKKTKTRSTASRSSETSKKRTTSKSNEGKSVQAKSSKSGQSNKMENKPQKLLLKLACIIISKKKESGILILGFFLQVGIFETIHIAPG